MGDDVASCVFCRRGFDRPTGAHKHARACLKNPTVYAATKRDLLKPGTVDGIRTAVDYEKSKQPDSAGVSTLLQCKGDGTTWDDVAEYFGLRRLYKTTRMKHEHGEAEERLDKPQPVSVLIDPSRKGIEEWDYMQLRTVRVREYVAQGRKVTSVYQEVGPFGHAGGARAEARAKARAAVRGFVQAQEARGVGYGD